MSLIHFKHAARGAANLALAMPGLHRLARAAARRGWLPERVWSGYDGRHPFVVSLGDSRFVYELVPGDYVGMPIYWRGLDAYEPDTLPVFARLARRARVFYDIGANTGLFTLLACAVNPTLTVRAFEPVPTTHAQLSRHVAANHLVARVEAVRLAVGAAPGRFEFGIPDGVYPTSAGFFLVDGHHSPRTTIAVEQTSIDAESVHHPPPDLVKLDVEGHEDEVLNGMPRLLDATPPVILLECLDDGPADAIERRLGSHGYRFLQLTAQGALTRPRLSGYAGSAGRNWLCLPPGAAP
ncbi:MAG: FkbM family methyltransferase [Gammaproteobacteria bacterium]